MTFRKMKPYDYPPKVQILDGDVAVPAARYSEVQNNVHRIFSSP